ncbi:MAG TPA: helix-turn-helix domain-containing protein [Flavipsychrobacter sp.]|nr:helix-turn-helix domain-containing protein [Flavipsychrobacter sp.]
MRHISILVPVGEVSVVNIEGTFQIFSEVNTLLQAMGKNPLFDVQLIGISKDVSQRNGRFSISPDLLIHEVSKTDLIIIPAIFGDWQKNSELNAAFFPWIATQYAKGAEIVSLCIAAFFLAKTGLLNGKQCATHWRFANEFRNMFPEVKLMDDKIMTEDSGIFSSGGAYSWLNLIIYLVEKYAGRDVAILISKAFMIDIDRHSQSPFIIFSGQKDHEDHLIKEAQEFIEKNYTEKITVDDLASRFAIGRRNFERRFKKATCNTVMEYVQRVKIEAAKMKLEKGGENVNEVMYAIGYSDIKAFRSTFKKITGLSPANYKNKYTKMAAA